jgi:hypothetical protein
MIYQRTCLTLCLLSLVVLPLVAVGQDGEASDVGQKSLAELRREVFQAEDDFYSTYNKLNDDRDYAVRCFYEKTTGSNIKNHICRARFVTKAYERHARRNRNDLSRVANQSADPILAETAVKYEAHMEVLIAANPELQAAFDRYNDARVLFVAKGQENDSN